MDSICGEAHRQNRWTDLADQVLAGEVLSAEQGREILGSNDTELLSLLDAAYRVRREYFGNKVQLYFLKNAKSGLCPEDCGYCSQAIDAETTIDRYPMLNEERLLAGARQAAEANARTYCIVASGRGPTQREVDHVARVARRIKDELGLHVCACLGLLTDEQAARLKEGGVDRVNHNLNTSRRYYDQICSTHTYDERMQTLKASRSAGLELCSGMIVGMGEQPDDVVETAIELRDLGVESIPVNFYHAIEGTRLDHIHELNPRYCLKALCVFRFANPKSEIRIAGGREVHLRSLQPLGLYPANSLFVSDYLTTKGQLPAEDYRLIEDLGFEIVYPDGMTPAGAEPIGENAGQVSPST